MSDLLEPDALPVPAVSPAPASPTVPPALAAGTAPGAAGPLFAHEGAPAAGGAFGADGVAGPVGLGVSVVVGAVVLLDRLGFLPARQPAAAAPAAATPPGPAPADLLARMASLETGIGAIETTVGGMDARDRQDAVVLGRLAEKVEGLGGHLERIEAALDALRRDGRDGRDGHGGRR